MFQEFRNQNAPIVWAYNQQHVKFQNTMQDRLNQKKFGPTN
jgi:hypothetical protein